METLPIGTYDGLRIELSKAVLTLHQVRRGAIHCSGVGKELCELFVEESRAFTAQTKEASGVTSCHG